ncbi:Holliday junction resolvase RuvX [Allohahella sp. A8]|uniref:Holliday junction resolvase RuvX n=1 Tax=Allohahella sp. A8 TaxID=3141461 RepID=UPI000C0AAB8F|nr:Holliday junction resolvase RuvX [Hahellaceae bacterium]
MNPVRVIGFDFGTRHIGVASGQSVTGRAQALPELSARDGIPDWNVVSRLMGEWQPDVVVVGDPLNMDGSVSEMSLRARKFARRVQHRFNIPVHMVDERLSSFEVRQSVGAGHDERVDSGVAALLIENWLAAQVTSH